MREQKKKKQCVRWNRREIKVVAGRRKTRGADGQWVPAASKGLWGVAVATVAAGAVAVAASTTTALTLSRCANPTPATFRRSSLTPPPRRCAIPATTCRTTPPAGRYGYTQWRHRQYATSITTDPADDRHPRTMQVTVAVGKGGGPCVKTAHGIMFPKKIKLIVYLLYDSILRSRPSVRLAPWSSPDPCPGEPPPLLVAASHDANARQTLTTRNVRPPTVDWGGGECRRVWGRYGSLEWCSIYKKKK